MSRLDDLVLEDLVLELEAVIENHSEDVRGYKVTTMPTDLARRILSELRRPPDAHLWVNQNAEQNAMDLTEVYLGLSVVQSNLQSVLDYWPEILTLENAMRELIRLRRLVQGVRDRV